MCDDIEDTEAFVAANDNIILVVFRGTSEGSDWITNLRCISRRVPEEWGLVGEGCDLHEVRIYFSALCWNTHTVMFRPRCTRWTRTRRVSKGIGQKICFDV